MKGNVDCHIPNDKYRDNYENIFKKKEKCSSCTNKYDGTNGSGYQPCGCGTEEMPNSPPNKV